MRKRRRLANKMTIMVCAVLLAVSAFFYAPMDVSAEEIVRSNSADFSFGSLNGSVRRVDLGKFLYDESALGSDFYRIIFDYSVEINTDQPVRILQLNGLLGDSGIFFHPSPSYSGSVNHNTFSGSKVVVLSGNYLKGFSSFYLNYFFYASSLGTINFEDNLILNISSITKLTGEDSESYQQGYNAGYSAGESAGYGNGYSQGFTDGEASVDTDAIYDEAFQAGKDSVDTESYYDAGYQAGYQVAYSEGYESGYDVGYQDAMDRIGGWGADTSDYPVLKYSFFEDELGLICDVFTSAPSTSYDSALLCYLDFDINPNHTYKFAVRTGGTTGGTYKALYSDYKLNFVIGSNVINATNNVGQSFDFFIPGYNMGSSILFEAFVYDCVYNGGSSEEDGFLKYSGQVYPTLKNCYIDIYDMGPSGDTQNHIANQTDQLTHGYDSSYGDSANSSLSTGLNEFESAENSLFATATTGMKDFTFFDFESVPAMLTAVTFITSIMGSWFEQAGGASGVGIVLSILFSVMLVSMVLGLYRLYQSAGHRAEARERHRERMEQWKKGK